MKEDVARACFDCNAGGFRRCPGCGRGRRFYTRGRRPGRGVHRRVRPRAARDDLADPRSAQHLGVLREAGFTLPMAAHAISLIDSYIGGHVLQETSLPMTTPTDVEEVAGNILEHLPPDHLPYLREMITDHALRPGYDYAAEFDYGLDLILDALEARRT
ncbi:TetR/AcrR family transcriptional regulator C-terminal domain-containing protein [Nocardia sp. CA-128927]|uniref:TetR/AcrR family transcriptional regulator C-terminal domain-containing protein n=1 Tax=Nocardia sp. CA-128927 TaxID=3239975 RepID=UPI003D96572C